MRWLVESANSRGSSACGWKTGSVFEVYPRKSSWTVSRRSRSPEWAVTFVGIPSPTPERRDDRERKLPLYARFGIPEASLIDTPARVIRVYREPEHAVYRTTGSMPTRLVNIETVSIANVSDLDRPYALS